mgnify:CR=1
MTDLEKQDFSGKSPVFTAAADGPVQTLHCGVHSGHNKSMAFTFSRL